MDTERKPGETMEKFMESFSKGDDAMAAKYVYEIYEKYLEKQRKKNFVVNRDNWNRLILVLEAFEELAKEFNGEVEPVELEPCKISGGATLKAYLLALDKGVYKDLFLNALRLADAVDIDAEIDGKVNVSVCVENVFEEAKDEE